MVKRSYVRYDDLSTSLKISKVDNRAKNLSPGVIVTDEGILHQSTIPEKEKPLELNLCPSDHVKYGNSEAHIDYLNNLHFIFLSDYNTVHNQLSPVDLSSKIFEITKKHILLPESHFASFISYIGFSKVIQNSTIEKVLIRHVNQFFSCFNFSNKDTENNHHIKEVMSKTKLEFKELEIFSDALRQLCEIRHAVVHEDGTWFDDTHIFDKVDYQKYQLITKHNFKELEEPTARLVIKTCFLKCLLYIQISAYRKNPIVKPPESTPRSTSKARTRSQNNRFVREGVSNNELLN